MTGSIAEDDATEAAAETFNDSPGAASVKSTIVGGGRMIREDEGIEVDLLSLPDLLRQLTPNGGEIALVKVDIEGAELEILESLKPQRLFDKLRCLIVETHERKFKDLRPRYRALREWVAASPLRLAPFWTGSRRAFCRPRH